MRMQGYMQNSNGYCNPAGPYRPHMPSLLPKGPSQTVFCNPIHPDSQMDKPRSCSTNVQIEEQPSWFDDLLNEPEIPVNKGHRRSSSDPFRFSKTNTSLDEVCLKSMAEGSTWGFQTPQSFQGQTPLNAKPSTKHQPQDELWKKSSTCSPLLKVVASSEEDVDIRALGMSCSSRGTDKTTSVENEMQNLVDGVSHSAENSCNGTETSEMKSSIPPPPGVKNDGKQKQHNTRRSRVRKLQYIAELERNVQVLQVHGAEVSAQLEFLDQQNILLGMENRALKRRLESLSQEYLIKSKEHEILDREIGRLQYLHQFQSMSHQQQRQRQKQNPGVHHRWKSCDLDSQFSKLSLNVSEPIATSNGFKDFPNR